MLTMSESIKELSEALSLAQGKIGVAKKDKAGYGYNYATLDNCLEVIKEPLAANGLAFIQMLSLDANGAPILISMLTHKSGEWMQAHFTLREQAVKDKFGKVTINDMQALGSGVTYLRRYTLCAMLGIAQEDDDGAASGPVKTTPAKITEQGSQKKVVAQVEAPQKDSIRSNKLMELCQARGFNPQGFAEAFHIKSWDVPSLQRAIDNFDEMATKYGNMEMGIEEDTIS